MIMHIIYKFIFALITLLFLGSAYANNALYKVIPLNNIYSLHAEGNITIEVEYGEEEKAEVFLRQDGVNDVIITTQQYSTKQPDDEPPRLTLKIREQPNTIDPIGEHRALAHIKLTLTKLTHIFADNLHNLTLGNGFKNEQDRLTLSLIGGSHANVSASTKKMIVRTRGESQLKLNNIVANEAYIKAYNNSRIFVTNSDISQHKVEVNGQANYQQKHSKTNDSTLTANSLARVKVDQSNQTLAVEISTVSASQVLFIPKHLKVAKVEARHHSTVNLGELDLLNATAQDQASISYQQINLEASTIKVRNQAKVVSREPAHE